MSVIERSETAPHRSESHQWTAQWALRWRRVRRGAGVAGQALCGLLIYGCLYDAKEPCGDGLEIYGDVARCVCPEDAVWTEDGCVKCGAHEVPAGTECQCQTGYARQAPDAQCQPAPPGLGASCNTDGECTDPDYPVCHPARVGTGYCTSECSAGVACTGSYVCEASTGTCQRPPLGAGQACNSDADCAGTEALYCDILITKTCMVQGCKVSPDDCFAGTTCCDFSAFDLPDTCLPEGFCRK